MPQLNVVDLVNAIAQLDTGKIYPYFSGRSKLQIEHITYPEGPISFLNVDAAGNFLRRGSVSASQLARFAAICEAKPDYPLHVDRVFSAGGNTRSALETLVAYTPHFFMCFPERIDVYSGETLTNLKHIMWCPNDRHPLGEFAEKAYNQVITEVELGFGFEPISLTATSLGNEFDSIEAKRTHVQMQIALIEIGNALNFKTWIAKPDQSIVVGNSTLGNYPGVVSALESLKGGTFQDYENRQAAQFIDCIWFAEEGRRIPAVIEIEHSTGVTSGLVRMQKLADTAPSLSTKYVIVAADSLRPKVVIEANKPIFRGLNAFFMPYSAVRELFGLIKRYSLIGVVDHKFINPFMERVVST